MNWIPIVVTAVLSSALTLVGLLVIYRFWLAPKLEREFARKLDAFGDEIEQRVKRGIHEGVASLPSTDMLRKTQSTVTRTAGDLVKDGLGTLLGRSGPRQPGGD